MNANTVLSSILVVDDDEHIFAALRRSLRQRYQLTYAPDAETALAVSGARRFDIILSDYRMPGMNGLELLELMQARHPSMVRLMMSADVNQQQLVAALERGTVFRALLKPWGQDELHTTLRFACQHAAELAFGEHLNRTNFSKA